MKTGALEQVSEILGIAPSLGEKSQDTLHQPELERIYQLCLKVRAEFTIEVDHSPVMASMDSFAARVDHSTRVITLNGFVLMEAGDSAAVREFLVFHELAHEFVKSPLQGLDLDEETSCDLVALYALQRGSF